MSVVRREAETGWIIGEAQCIAVVAPAMPPERKRKLAEKVFS